MKHRIGFITKNLLRMAVLLLSVAILTFTLVSLSPIDPLSANVGQTALGSLSAEQIAKLEAYWGVDQPAPARFGAWAKDFIRGDMGVSLYYRQDVSTVIKNKLSNSLILMLSAWILSGILGFFLGVLAGMKKDSLADKIIQGYCLTISSTPVFWLALALLLIFAVGLKWLPVGLSVPIGVDAAAVTFADKVRHAILPALTLSITGISGICLHTREKMISVMESDYALLARARGDRTSRIARRHGLRNVLLPAITLQFAAIAEIFGGSVLVEQVFSYPGLGEAAVRAGLGSDVPLLLAITIISAAIVFFGNFIANILYGIVDPRIRRRARQ